MTWLYVLIALAGASTCIATLVHALRAYIDGPPGPKPSILAATGLLPFDLAALVAPVALQGIVPEFVDAYAHLEGELPAGTLLLLRASDAVVGSGWLGALLFALLAWGLTVSTRRLMAPLPRGVGLLVMILCGLATFCIAAAVLLSLYIPLLTMPPAIG